MKRFAILCIFLISLFLLSAIVCAQDTEPVPEPFVEPLEEPPVPLVETAEDVYVEPVEEVLPELPPEQEIDVSVEEVPVVPEIAEELPPLPEPIEEEFILEEETEPESSGSAVLFPALIIFAILIAFFIFWLLMLIDCAKRNFAKEGQKTVWIVIIVLIQLFIPVGAIIYYFAVKRRARK